MPGLVGALSTDPQAAARVDAMARTLADDPALTSGRLHGAAHGIHAAWAVHAGSFAEQLPVRNAAGDITLLFHGEVFTDAQRLRRLRRPGRTFADDDAAHLVAWYEDEGEAFVEQLNGRFCGLLVDCRRGRALLFNDRYGADRLYLHEAADGLYFASQAQCLLRVFEGTRRLDATAVAQTFTLGCVIGERTLYTGIGLLPPASRWAWRAGQPLERSRYFDARTWEQQAPLPDAQFAQTLHDTFSELLPQYLRGRTPPAMSLTGGLDSRMIMACAQPAPGALPCYSFGGLYGDCHDVKLARRIAALCGQTHQTLRADERMLREFPALAERCIEVSGGAMDVSGAVELYVNRLAREVSPVRLTGNYGSEIVRSNVAFKPRAIAAQTLQPQLEPLVADAQAAYRQARDERSDLAFVAFAQVPWHHHARLAVEQSVLVPRSPYLDNRLVALMFRASEAQRHGREASMAVLRDDARLGALPTDRGLVAGRPGLVDRLRHALRELSMRAEYAYDYGMPAPLVHLDRVLQPLQPERLFLGRHKFYHFRVWYRRELAPFVQDLLLSANATAPSWYRAGVLRRMVIDHVAGRANHTLDLHRALTLELVQQRLLRSDNTAGAT
jgi:asparagine synthase (glutamine-hydrolysing)